MENVDREISIRKIVIRIVSIEPQDEYEGPWTLREQLDLAAGSEEYVPLVSFGEPYVNSKVVSCFDAADTFAEF